MQKPYPTLVDLLQSRASAQPEDVLYTFLTFQKDEAEEEQLTYGELDRRARVLGVYLQAAGAQNERILLIYPPGLHYIIAFFACLYAGAIAVPAYPPQFNRLEQQNRTLSKRFQAIYTDAQPLLALTTQAIYTKVSILQLPELSALRWVPTDEFVSADTTTTWVPPAIAPDTLAFLQYTSGSTSSPKGVMLTHAHLLYNLALIQRYFEHTEASKGVIWLPPYHDMGLIGGILQPLYAGFPVVLMAPLSFLQKPLRWLQAISHYQATTSGGPNFAYDLCLRKISAEERAQLDLSSWRVAFNGAEPIWAETMRAFATTFASTGFRAETFHPCYGLAEATLLVSGSDNATPPRSLTVRSEALLNNQVVPLAGSSDADATSISSSGTPAQEQQLCIVDPNTLQPCPENQVGEIWVAGGSVASGYWRQPVQTQEIFQAFTADQQGPFLRTGDLGFLHQSELFVTGRLRDLIIIHGANYYPQDIEQFVEEKHPMLRPGCTAAFSIQVGGEEKLALACEMERTARHMDLDELIQQIRQGIAGEYVLELHMIAILKAGSVPKTSSGKLQRAACRADLLAGQLPVLASATLSLQHERERGLLPDEEEGTSPLNRQDLLEGNEAERQQRARRYLLPRIANILGVVPSTLTPEQPLTSLGIDSLKAIEVAYLLQSELHCDISLDLLLSGMSVNDLAIKLVQSMTEHVEDPLPPVAVSLVDPQPLSRGQKALWFLQQLAPTNTAYNIARAVRIHTHLDRELLKAAFEQLIIRHLALRTTFTTQDEKLLQVIHPSATGTFFHYEDAAHWSQKQMMERIAQEAHCVFDLASGPLFHVWLFARSAQEFVLLLVGHHLVLDFWSLATLTHELGRIYTALQQHQTIAEATLAHLPFQYPDYVQQQELMLQGTRGEALWRYWQSQLAGELPILNLPTDKPRPAVQTYTGAFTTLRLSDTLTAQLKTLSQRQNVTLYTLLLAAFQVLLARYCGQEEIILGSLTNGRTQRHLKDVVGYFVNPLVILAHLQGNPTFEEHLARVRTTVLEAFAHQDFPFATLAEKLQPVRDPSRSPIFQAMFVWQKVPVLDGVDLASLALNSAGQSFVAGALPMETMEIAQYTTQFDVTLAMGETNTGLQASLQYNTNLFTEETMGSLLANFAALLEGIVGQPERRLADLPVFTTSTENALLALLSHPASGEPAAECIHTLFERQVACYPQETALIYQDQVVSYGELNRRANQLAHCLRTVGVGPEVRVGICLHRSVELLVGLLAILKAGGAYVPLDPAYPRERLAYISSDAALSALVTIERFAELFDDTIPQICLDTLQTDLEQEPTKNLAGIAHPSNPAYVIYTSGSTGKPKGVVLEHRSVINFFQGMDERIGCSREDTLMALTSVSFDISVLELFWTLVNGARVVLMGEHALLGSAESGRQKQTSAQAKRELDFSLFYFANDDATANQDRYRLLLEGARFADTHGFAAIWTPERHFHGFGGLYPNPSITSAALATITTQVQLRAGSVVLPLHSPLRVAEEWSVIDNLSNGRVGMAFASGWHANDFALAPHNYAERKDVMFEGIKTVQQLWEGHEVAVHNGVGQEISVRIFPSPIQPHLPIWITAAGSDATFIKAGEIGANVLTHLLGQSVEDVSRKIKLYRDARERHGFDRASGKVTLMLHTFISSDETVCREKVRVPFTNYLRTSVGLIDNLIKTLQLPLDLKTMSAQDMDDLLAFAVDRYFGTSALFGTPESCLPLINKLKSIDVDEVACLLDFGIDTQDVLASLPLLDRLRELSQQQSQVDETPEQSYTLVEQARKYPPTLLQCTPSAMQLMSMDDHVLYSLRSLRMLLLGGEALPPALVTGIQRGLPVPIENMYGPTETTIWSSTFSIPVSYSGETIPIGHPIANTQIYILDRHLNLVPPGVTGEIYIGGAGLARGYLGQPHLTAERFVPDPFSSQGGQRLYRTGDLGRYQPDGLLLFLGRADQQVKMRGFRIELEEIEAVLGTHPAISEVVVNAVQEAGSQQLVAYLVPKDANLLPQDVRPFLKEKLPEYMLPSRFAFLSHFPLTANGKVDRAALTHMTGIESPPPSARVVPRNHIEQVIAEIWKKALNVEQVGIHDNFFDLGGHSLLIAQVHTQLKTAFKQELPLVKLLEYPTIDALARYFQTVDRGQTTLQQSVDRAKTQREAQLRRLQRQRV